MPHVRAIPSPLLCHHQPPHQGRWQGPSGRTYVLAQGIPTQPQQSTIPVTPSHCCRTTTNPWNLCLPLHGIVLLDLLLQGEAVMRLGHCLCFVHALLLLYLCFDHAVGNLHQLCIFRYRGEHNKSRHIFGEEYCHLQLGKELTKTEAGLPTPSEMISTARTTTPQFVLWMI